MNYQKTMRAACSLVIVVGAGSFAYSADDHHHHHPAVKQEALKLNQGKKWETDLALRQSMEQIQKLVKEKLSDVRTGKMNDEGFRQLGELLKEQTNLIFKNCKLKPAADKELHKVLLPILNAEKTLLAEESLSLKQKALDAVAVELGNYGKHFEHPKWHSVE